MSFWFILWVLISVFLLGFLAWTILILVRQKAVWKSYAAKHQLRYKPNSFFEVPEMNGIIDTHSVSVFSGEHSSPDARYSRKMTAIEIQLASKMPIEGGVASNGMTDIVQGLNFKDESTFDHKSWKKTYIAKSANRTVLEAYLTPERLDALTNLMKVENFWIILIFKDDVMLLRLDTSDPLNTEAKLDKVVKGMIKTAQALELNDGEADRLAKVEAKAPAKAVSIDLDEKTADSIGLELEEDEEPSEDQSSEENPSTEKE